MSISNYEIAKHKADEIDTQIISTLNSGKSFRVEAGAGSGKTYSLNRVIDWIQDNYWKSLKSKKQNVACITYTNVGVNVISSRLREDSSIQPMTIHSFAWGLIKQFSSSLKRYVIDLNLVPKGVTSSDFDEVQYTLGVKCVEGRVLYISHDDVIKLFSSFMDNAKFRRILSLQYPIILIDEYQDSLKQIISQLLRWYINKNEGPQFGFFGDSWQTIYDKSSCGEINSKELVAIGKESNFRSQGVIVEVLNRIRPELPQITASEKCDGKVLIVTCNDYKGPRKSGYYKDELPDDELLSRIDGLQKYLAFNYGWNIGTHVTLMITHKMLAKQQHYTSVLSVLGDRFKDGQDCYLIFFQNTVEPLFSALLESKLTKVYDALGSDNYPIQSKNQKQKWVKLKEELEKARNKTIADVMDVIINATGIKIPVPLKVQENHRAYLTNPESIYANATIGEFYNITYEEIINALEYLNPKSSYSTDHGSKGEEYDNVLFVMGKGWNNYQFDKYLGRDINSLSGQEYEAYIRNRNLFYVCCSRAKKNLVLLITIPLGGNFLSYLQNVFGHENIITYEELMI